MSFKNIKMLAHKNLSRGAVEFYMRQLLPSGRVAIAQPVIMLETENDGYDAEPFITLDYDAMQSCIDDLWNIGFRPSGVSDLQLTAQGRHLEDMRAIAFKFLKLKGE